MKKKLMILITALLLAGLMLSCSAKNEADSPKNQTPVSSPASVAEPPAGKAETPPAVAADKGEPEKGKEGEKMPDGEKVKASPVNTDNEAKGKIPETAKTPNPPDGSKETPNSSTAGSSNEVVVKPPPPGSDVEQKFDKAKNAAIPDGSKLERFWDDRLCVLVQYPKKWKADRSDARPEFQISNPDIKGMKVEALRIKIMKGRSFKDEVSAILKNKYTGRTIKVDKETVTPLGKDDKIMRVVSHDYYKDTDGKTRRVKDSVYIFISAGDEISMFFFETPSQYSKKALPLFEKMIKTIQVQKRKNP